MFQKPAFLLLWNEMKTYFYERYFSHSSCALFKKKNVQIFHYLVFLWSLQPLKKTVSVSFILTVLIVRRKMWIPPCFSLYLSSIHIRKRNTTAHVCWSTILWLLLWSCYGSLFFSLFFFNLYHSVSNFFLCFYKAPCTVELFWTKIN